MFCAEPCNFAHALITSKDKALLLNICLHGALLPHAELLHKCPKGLTPKQAAILVIVAQRQGVVMSYGDIAQAANTAFDISLTKVAVRELADKLNARGFFQVCEMACEGILQGKRYVLSEKCCPFLLPQGVPHPPPQTSPQGIPQPPAQGPAQAVPQSPAHSALLLKKKKKKEEVRNTFLQVEAGRADAISEELFTQIEAALPDKWPSLLRIGFDYARFLTAAKSAPDPEYFAKTCWQSLDYAEFAVRHLFPQGKMKTEKGEQVRQPCSWILGCFRKSSYFPRPPDYKTREDLAELAAKEAEQKQEEAAMNAARDIWINELSLEERDSILSRVGFGPPDVRLRLHFAKQVWPALKESKNSRFGAITPLTSTERKETNHARA